MKGIKQRLRTATDARQRQVTPQGYLEELWEAHDWLEREIIKQERKYTDKELDTMLER